MTRPAPHVPNLLPAPAQQAVVDTLDAYGALIAPDLAALHVTPAQLEDAGLTRCLPTIIGPLWFAADPCTDSAGTGRRIPRRTLSSAISAAYVRLYLHGSAPAWTIPDARTLGFLSAALHERMPHRRVRGQQELLAGRAHGQGYSVKRVSAFLNGNRLRLDTASQRVIILTPTPDRFTALLNAHPLTLGVQAYTHAHAQAANTLP